METFIMILKRIVAALLILALLALPMSACELSPSGETLIKTDKVSVSEGMITYFFNAFLNDWYATNYQYISYYALDPSADLSKQTYGSGYEKYFLGDYDGTWYDYFLDQVMDNVELYVIYADYARDCGLVLNDDDQGKIDELMIEETVRLREEGLKYKQKYGVDEETVRSCYELVMLAKKGIDRLIADSKSKLEDDGAAVEKFVAENKSEFYSAKYLFYSIYINKNDYKSDEDYNSAKEIALMEANRIAEAKTSEQFVTLVEDFRNKLLINDDDHADMSMEELLDEYTNVANYETDSDIGKWLFEKNAKKNAVKIFQESATVDSSDSKREVFKVEICMVLEPAGLDRRPVSRFAYLLANDKSNVESLVKSFKSGDKSVKDFFNKAEQQYADMGEDREKIGFSYGYTTAIGEDYFNSDFDALNDWLSADNIAPNTLSEIIEIKLRGDNDMKVEYNYFYSDTVTDATGGFVGGLYSDVQGGTSADYETKPDTETEPDSEAATGGFATVYPMGGGDNFAILTPSIGINGGITLRPNLSNDGNYVVHLKPSVIGSQSFETSGIFDIMTTMSDGISASGGSGADLLKNGTVYALVFFEDYGDEAWYFEAYDMTLSSMMKEWEEEAGGSVSVSHPSSTLNVVAQVKDPTK